MGNGPSARRVPSGARAGVRALADRPNHDVRPDSPQGGPPGDLRARATRFASLQAAQRGLARSLHPAELATIRDQGRDLLIRLQGLAGESVAPGGAVSSDAVAEIDLALDEQTERTRELLANTALPQLRASVPILVLQHRDEVQGLVDVLLEGDLGETNTARILEYLVTMLATEDRHGRRLVVCDPAEVTSRLATAAAMQTGGEAEEACLIAERVFEDATTLLLQGGEVGAIRDRVRRYKQELGAGIVHPRTLAAAVAYNAAMWNHVAAEIDSSRAIEQLAEDLFAAPATPHPPPARSGEETAAERGDPSKLLQTRSFLDLVLAVRARARGGEPAGGAIGELAARLPFDSLRAEDVEALDADADGAPDGAGEQAQLIQQAIVVGLVLRARADLTDAILDVGLDPDDFDEACVGELVGRMSELARKHFAESHYSEAFRLSEVKMRSLGAYGPSTAADAADRRSDVGGPRPGRPGRAARKASPAALAGPSGRLAQLAREVVSGPAIAVILLAAILGGLIYSPPILDPEPALPTAKELEAISPFLEWGREAENAHPRRFVGRLSPAWRYVDTPQRRQVVDAIGVHFAEVGVPSVVLVDESEQVVAQYAQGEVVLLSPRAPRADGGRNTGEGSSS